MMAHRTTSRQLYFAVMHSPRFSQKTVRLFVWGVWLALTAAAVGFWSAFSFPFPARDELANVPWISGARPITLEWLWSQHGEHRITLPRLLYLGVGWVTGFDFRFHSLLSVALLALTAAALLWAVRRARGSYQPADIVLPAVLLNWGHAKNLVFGFNLQFTTSTALAGGLLALVLRHPLRLPLPVIGLAALGVALLPLCGGNGVVLVPAFGGWLLSAAYLRYREGDRRGAWIQAGVAVAALLPTALYFVGYQRRYPLPTPEMIPGVLVAALEFLNLSVGLLGRDLWWSTLLPLLLLLLFTVAVLLRRLMRGAEDPLRSSGLLLLLAAQLLTALVVGVGRASLGFSGAATRYPTAACLLVLGIYATFAHQRLPRLLQGVLVLTALALVGTNIPPALEMATADHGEMRLVQEEADDGLPPEALGYRYALVLKRDTATCMRCMTQLHQAGLAPYRSDSPPRALRPVRVEPWPPLAGVDDRSGRRPSASVRKILTLRAGTARRFALRPADAGGKLYRLDLHWIPPADLQGLEEDLSWTLLGLPGDGRRVDLLAGRPRTLEFLADSFLSLRFPPTSLPEGWRVLLVLRGRKDAPDPILQLPLYQPVHPKAPLSPRGYLFFEVSDLQQPASDSVHPGATHR